MRFQKLHVSRVSRVEASQEERLVGRRREQRVLGCGGVRRAGFKGRTGAHPHGVRRPVRRGGSRERKATRAHQRQLAPSALTTNELGGVETTSEKPV